MDSSKPLPPDIAAKVVLLKQHRETIEKLSRRCEELEKEISSYHELVAPVKKCPPEMLSIIFRDYLSENPRLIRRLLLVCRRWYHILITTPTFWMNIPIIISTEQIYAKKLAESIAPRLLAFCKHSQSLPLRISMDFWDFSSVRYIIGQEEDNMRSICFGGSQTPEIDLYLQYGDILETSTQLPWHPNHVIKALSLLNQHMNRWATLEVLLPYDRGTEFMGHLWNLFTGPTPQLSHIRIDASYDDAYIRDMPQCIIFPNLPSLKSFSTNDGNLLEHFDMSSSPVEHLSISWRSSTNFKALHLLRSLKSLELREGTGRNMELDLMLPQVKTLIFKGNIYETYDVHVIAPSLEQIRVENNDIWFINQLTSISPKHFCWLVPGKKYLHSPPSGSQKPLEDILRRYTAIETLTICNATERDLEKVVTKLRLARQLPVSFSLVRVMDDEDYEKEIRTWSVQ